MRPQGVSRESLMAARERLDNVVGSGVVDAATLGDELFSVVHVLDQEHSLRRVLSDPGLPASQKAMLVREVLGGKVGTATLEILHGLARARWSGPSDLVGALEELAVRSLTLAAERDGRLDDLEDELFRFSRIVEAALQPRAAHASGPRPIPTLRAVLSNPAVPAFRKRELIESLLGGRVTAWTLRLATEASVHPRGRTVERALAWYARLAAQLRERLVAHVRVASPLAQEQRSRLVAVLGAAYGNAVHLNVEVDPDVLGGISVQIGDEVIDGTVASRIAAARRRLAG